MHDLGLCGVETCRGHRHRYQTPLKLLIYRCPFGNYGRVTDYVGMLVCLLLMLRLEGVEGNEIRGGNWLRGRRGEAELGWVSHNFSNFSKKRPAAGCLARREG